MGKQFRRYYHRQPSTCIFCDVVLANTQNLEGHMNTHTQERPYFCLYCDATFSQKSGQIYHQKIVHLKIKKKCVKCHRKFSVGSTLHAHQKICKGKRGRGKIAKKTVPIKARKKRDDSKWKRSMSPPVMEGEENNFPNTEAHHATSIVNNNQIMKYPEYLVVPPGSNLAYPPFKLCNATIDSDQQRWDPLFFLHMNRYKMEDTTTASTPPDNLRVQKSTSTVKPVPRGPVNLEGDDNDEVNLTCRQCGKVYSNKWNLRKHLRLHTGDKQYTCHFCQRTFFEKCNAVRHIAVMHQEGIVNKSSRTGSHNPRCGFCGDHFPPGGLSQLHRHISSNHDNMLCLST